MKYGLIGKKLEHSYSKVIHSRLGNYDYKLVEVNNNKIMDFMQKHDFAGINVTIPYKKKVMSFLDYIDLESYQIGAVNTVVVKNGELYGYNTDCYGMIELINKNNINLKNKIVAILGTGGASNTAYFVASLMEATKVFKVSRNYIDDKIISYNDLYDIRNQIDVIINTTPVGMYPHIDRSPIDIYKFTRLVYVIDIIYNPIMTTLVSNANCNGIKAVNGLYMLVAQATKTYDIFFDENSCNTKNDIIYKYILDKFNKYN